MKWKKKLMIGIISLLVIILIAVVVVIVYLNAIVAGAMRTFGTQATGTKLEVKSVNISLLGGGLRINNLSIANPTGYKSENALSFDLVAVDMDVNSIFSDTIVINKVEIANLKVDFEPTLSGGSNLTDIKNNIMKFTQGEGEAKKAEPEKATEPAVKKKGKKILIKSFVINKGAIAVSSNMLKAGVSVPLPRMELTDIGKERNIGEAFAGIFDEILKAVVDSVASAKIDGLGIDKLKSTLLKDLPASTESVGKNINKTLKNIKELF